jgi:hypothetical protein
MLVLVLATQQQLTLGRTTVRNALHRLRLRWRRPRLAMPRKTDPEKARKQWSIAEAVITAGADAAVVYADDSRWSSRSFWMTFRTGMSGARGGASGALRSWQKAVSRQQKPAECRLIRRARSQRCMSRW